jgi:hypothetical protein
VCAEGKNQNTGTHGLIHTFQSATAAKCKEGSIALEGGGSVTGKKTTYGQAKKDAYKAFKKTFPESDCSEDCITGQLDAYHNQCGITDETEIKAVETGQTDVSAAQSAVNSRTARIKDARTVRSGGSR